MYANQLLAIARVVAIILKQLPNILIHQCALLHRQSKSGDLTNAQYKVIGYINMLSISTK